MSVSQWLAANSQQGIVDQFSKYLGQQAQPQSLTGINRLSCDAEIPRKHANWCG